MSKSTQHKQVTGARLASQAAQVSSGSNRGFLTMAGIGIGIVIVAVAALVVSRANQTQQTAAAASLPDSVSVAEAVELRDSGAFMLDVRTPEEWAEYHMPGSTLIPLFELERRVAEVPRDRPVVVVCRSGNRSQEGRDILKAAGFTSVASMAGGLSEWRDQGLPTESGE